MKISFFPPNFYTQKVAKNDSLMYKCCQAVKESLTQPEFLFNKEPDTDHQGA